MDNINNILHKLYKSWIYAVFFICIIGFIISSTVTIHDSIIAYIALNRLQKVASHINPNGHFRSEIEKAVNDWEDISDGDVPKDNIAELLKTKQNVEFAIKESERFYENRWGDGDFSNISYLLICSLWIVAGAVIIAISHFLKRWIIWLLYQ